MEGYIGRTEWKEGRVKNFFGKDLLSLDNGSVKLVRVVSQAIYPEHIHPDRTEYVYVLKGFRNFQIDQEEFSAKPDEFYVFPSKVKHAIRNYCDSECLLLVGNIKDIDTGL